MKDIPEVESKAPFDQVNVGSGKNKKRVKKASPGIWSMSDVLLMCWSYKDEHERHNPAFKKHANFEVAK